jgi:ribonuclease P protein component
VHTVQNQESFARLGIIVGKRTVQHAVARNFLKRLIRETFRRQQDRLAGYDVLVRARRRIEPADAILARAELSDLLDAAVE